MKVLVISWNSQNETYDVFDDMVCINYFHSATDLVKWLTDNGCEPQEGCGIYWELVNGEE